MNILSRPIRNKKWWFWTECVALNTFTKRICRNNAAQHVIDLQRHILASFKCGIHLFYSFEDCIDDPIDRFKWMKYIPLFSNLSLLQLVFYWKFKRVHYLTIFIIFSLITWRDIKIYVRTEQSLFWTNTPDNIDKIRKQKIMCTLLWALVLFTVVLWVKPTQLSLKNSEIISRA